MTFQVSPGVQVKEIDLTSIIPSVSTTRAGFAGNFNKGPVGSRTLITSVNQLRSLFSAIPLTLMRLTFSRQQTSLPTRTISKLFVLLAQPQPTHLSRAVEMTDLSRLFLTMTRSLVRVAYRAVDHSALMLQEIPVVKFNRVATHSKFQLVTEPL